MVHIQFWHYACSQLVLNCYFLCKKNPFVSWSVCTSHLVCSASARELQMCNLHQSITQMIFNWRWPNSQSAFPQSTNEYNKLCAALSPVQLISYPWRLCVAWGEPSSCFLILQQPHMLSRLTWQHTEARVRMAMQCASKKVHSWTVGPLCQGTQGTGGTQLTADTQGCSPGVHFQPMQTVHRPCCL